MPRSAPAGAPVASGVYGLLSYLVSRRTREIGIRVAVGASRGQVLRLVLTSGLGLALTGVVAGLAAAAWLVRLMTALLHDVAPLASLVPAWRATRVNPVTALKAE